MGCEIVIRAARPQDEEARAQLIKAGIASYDCDAIIFFLLQEVTVQTCMLLGAVMLIFAGAGVRGAALVPGALVLLAGGGVLLAHRAAARRHAARLRRELAGWVAELRGAPAPGARPRLRAAAAGEAPRGPLVGTLSLAAHRGERRRGWLSGPAVAAAWRRRGVGGALLAAARRHGAARGLRSLELAASAVQADSRALLLARGWAARGAYHRRLLGAALTLPMMQLGLDLQD